jgi:drug/metabolite transporter (DMT)-like permease
VAQTGIGAAAQSGVSETAGTSRAARTPGTGASFAHAAAPTRLRIYGALGFGVICIALSAIFTVWANLPGTVSAFYRVAIASAVLAAPFGLRVARGKVALDWRVWLLAGGAGIFFAADLALWNTSLLMIPAATSTLLGNDAPIIVGLGAMVLFRERLRPMYWLGLAVALLGMGTIVGRDLVAGSNLGIGDLLSLAAGCSYAFYLLATQRIRSRLDTLASLWIPAATGSVLLLIFNLATRQPLAGFSVHSYLALLGMALVSQVAGWLAINYALGHLPASIVSVTLLAQPVLTALFAVPLLQQALSVNQILGGGVALVGIYIVNRSAVRG